MEGVLKMKYSVEVGSFCTRLITRKITVSAGDEAEATKKAIDKFIDKEQQLANSNDFGDPKVDFIEEINS